MKKRFVGPNGLRAGWKAAILLALAYLLTLGTTWGLNALAQYLYGIWGVTPKNIHRAPGWILLLSGHWGEWVSIAQNLLLWPFAHLLFRLLTGKRLPVGRCAGRGLALGAAGGLLLTALLLAIDGVRLGAGLAYPGWSWELLIPLGVYASAALGGEALFRGALRGLLGRLPAHGGCLLGAAAFALMTAPAWEPFTLINLLLLGLILECAARKTGGYLCGAAGRFSLYAALFVLAGYAGRVSLALYECYPAAHDLLSGGSRGPLGGLLATLFLLVGAAGGLKNLHPGTCNMRPFSV